MQSQLFRPIPKASRDRTDEAHLTSPGTALGTVAYMSPEQVRGHELDARTDLFSFGVVLYEMATGAFPFTAKVPPSSAKPSNRAPVPAVRLNPDVPAKLEDIIDKAFEKDRNLRYQHASDMRTDLKRLKRDSDTGRTAVYTAEAPDEASGAFSRSSAGIAAHDSTGRRSAVSSATATSTQPVAAATTISAPRARPAWFAYLPWALAALLAAGLAYSLVSLRASRNSGLGPIELSLSIPPTSSSRSRTAPPWRFHPTACGSPFATREPKSAKPGFYVRPIGKGSASLLKAREIGFAPFFSPDSQWIGFFGDGKLKKVSVRGGAAITLGDVGAFRGGTWGEDGTIIFPQQFTSPLSRIRDSGGAMELATHLDSAHSEITQRWPQILPGDKSVLFTASSNNNFFGHATVDAAPLDTGAPKILVENAYFGRYLPGGYLAYVSQGTVFMVPFDAKSLKVTGTAIPVLQGVESDITNGSAQLGFSDTGTVVYLPGAANHTLNFTILDRHGNVVESVSDQQSAASPRFSPDGKRYSFQKSGSGVWIHDIERGTTSAISGGTAAINFPLWTPDGQWLTYIRPDGSAKDAGDGIFMKRADGTGDERQLTSRRLHIFFLGSWSPDGKILIFAQLSEKTGSCCEIWTLALDASGKPQEPKLFMPDTGGPPYPAFSYDGRWVAYVSYESGTPQVYVVPFEGTGGKWQISTDGGIEPRWSKTGHELFYAQGKTLLGVPVFGGKELLPRRKTPGNFHRPPGIARSLRVLRCDAGWSALFDSSVSRSQRRRYGRAQGSSELARRSAPPGGRRTKRRDEVARQTAANFPVTGFIRLRAFR